MTIWSFSENRIFFDKYLKYFDIFFIMRSRIDFTCSCFRISLIMTTIFNDSEFARNVLSAKSIWLIVMKKHCISCFRFLKSISKQKNVASIIVIFIESFEFSSEEKANSNCCFLIFHLLLRCFFKSRFLHEIVFVTITVFISDDFCLATKNSLSRSIFESTKNSKFAEFDSFYT